MRRKGEGENREQGKMAQNEKTVNDKWREAKLLRARDGVGVV